ncbi:MAG TPA: Ig-like domain-containing protein [Chryseolinea sp.]|nr:Ig-like domain-containing protein [Chryseolinea sp.]HPM31444.1 Ig-like domain-containing protein [Chryseolinea sp.]
MKNLKWILCGLVAIGFIVTGMEGCSSDDSGPTSITLATLTAGGVDLNGAASGTDIPVDAPIIATFSTDVDASTATAANIILTQDYDEQVMDATISVAGKVVTVTPSADLAGGTLYTLNFTAGLESTNGKALSALERNFATEGTFVPSNVIAHWTFENSTEDVVGTFDPGNAGTDVTYVDSRSATAGKAASFNGTTTIIEVPNGNQLMSHNDFTLSFWVKADGSKEGHFVMGLAGWYGFQFEIAGGAWTAVDKGVKIATRYQLASTTDAEDTWWNGQANGWQGSLFAKVSDGAIGTTFKDKWANVVCTYDAASKVGSMYVNGEKVRAWDFDQWPDGDAKKGATGVTFAGNTTGGGNNLAFGFIQASGNRKISDTWADPSDPANNHFKGLLDDVRVFSRAITATEVTLIYNSEKP